VLVADEAVVAVAGVLAAAADEMPGKAGWDIGAGEPPTAATTIAAAVATFIMPPRCMPWRQHVPVTPAHPGQHSTG
jgi:hypothetical protein